MKTIRVLIADDHAIVRRGLRSTLESHTAIEICAEAANGRESVALALKHRPDVIVMDFNMPELNGLEATREICRDDPQARVLILSAHDSEQLVREMLISGARGYVLKSDAAEDLVSAVEALAAGRLFFTSSVSDVVLRGLREGSPPEDGSTKVTPREREIIRLLAEGQTNKQIAAHLDLSVKTVETHRKNIMSKLGFRSLSDLVRFAIQNHFIEV